MQISLLCIIIFNNYIFENIFSKTHMTDFSSLRGKRLYVLKCCNNFLGFFIGSILFFFFFYVCKT